MKVGWAKARQRRAHRCDLLVLMSAVGTRFALCPPYGLMSAGMTKWGDRAEPRSPDAATATRSHNPDDGYSKTKRPAREAPADPDLPKHQIAP